MNDWTYSSYQTYLTDKKTKVAKEKVLNWFGNTKEFKNFHTREKFDTSFDL